MAHLRVFVNDTKGAERTVQLPEDWDTMDQEERNDYCEEEAQDFASQRVHYGYEVVE